MIIFELFIFLISIIFFFCILSGYGSLISGRNVNNFFEEVFLGFLVISLITTFVHFFLKIDLIISGIIFLIGFIFFLKKKRFFNILRIDKFYYYFFLVIFLLPMFVSQKYHEDFGYYHLPYSLAFLADKIIFGFANIDRPYVYNSIWLNINSIFFLKNNNFNFQTLPSFLLFLNFILFSVNKVIEKKQIQLSDYYLTIVVFYFLLKFTRISEFGVDFPSTIFSILSIFYFIKFYETNKDFEKKNYFYLNLSFAFFSILIKLSTLPILILTLFLYFSNFQNFKIHIFKYKFLMVYFLCLIFFIQQFIFTGCILFPTSYTCLDVSWFSVDHLQVSKQLELINKSYSEAKNIYSREEFLNNFTWFSFWFKRNFIEIIEHTLTIFLPILIFTLFLEKEKNKNKQLLFKSKNILYFFIIISFIFWLSFSPVVRFAIFIFVTFIFLIISNIFFSKIFSKKKFIVFIFIFLTFNFSKNILRINQAEELFLGIKKIDNKFVLKKQISNTFVNIYQPDINNNKKNGWQGRLCWETPFICSYNNLDVYKKYGYLIINKLEN